jgi:hypothetical protein
LGFIVFAIGTFVNFAALQFAAQSLIGPLSSFSLVCNVIVAPILNGEVWTWKDIVGVFFIVGGSAIVVVFSGTSSPDYNICVLIKLFQQADTIIFLTITCTLIFSIFIFIVVVEKNLLFKEASAVVITETLNTGELVKVEAHTSRSHNALNRRLSYQVADQLSADGSHLRVVTIITPSQSKSLHSHNADQDESSNSDDEEEVDVDSIKAKPSKNLVDSDGNNINDLLHSKTPDGDSIQSMALTFKIPDAKPVVEEEIESISSADKGGQFGKETVVVLPKLPKKQARSKWLHNIITKARNYPFIAWVFDLEVIPRLEEKIPLDSKMVRFGLPFSYASLGVSFILLIL